MALFSIQHSKASYYLDIALYACLITVTAASLAAMTDARQSAQVLGHILLGIFAWTLLEYLLHRFVLHGLKPFSQWHGEHHARPRALICSPTLLSAGLIAGLVFLPMWLATQMRTASAVTLGLLLGYLAYTLVHHATHHWRSRSRWLTQRKRCHALHHRPQASPANFGVTSSLWDRVFGTHIAA